MRKGSFLIPIIIVGAIVLGLSGFLIVKYLTHFEKPQDSKTDETKVANNGGFGDLLQNNADLTISTPTPVPSPSIIPSPTPTPLAVKSPEIIPPTLKLEAVTQNSVDKYLINLKGVGFGEKTGSVSFRDTSGSTILGAGVYSWSSTLVAVLLPDYPNCHGNWEVGLVTENGKSSNKLNLATCNIHIDSIDPPNVGPYDGSITIKGSGFGDRSSYVAFSFGPNTQTVGSCIIVSWSDKEVVCNNLSVPQGNQYYDIRIIKSGGEYSTPLDYKVS